MSYNGCFKSSLPNPTSRSPWSQSPLISVILSCFIICLVIWGNILDIVITIVKTLDSVILFQRVLIFLFWQTINLDGLSSKFVLLYSSDFSVLGVLSEGYSTHA